MDFVRCEPTLPNSVSLVLKDETKQAFLLFLSPGHCTCSTNVLGQKWLLGLMLSCKGAPMNKASL